MSDNKFMEIEEITTPILIYIEGNIGCGKSTIMQHYNNYKNVDILCEPIELWENFHGSNLLELQYKKQFNFLFQTTVYISRLEQMNKCSKSVRIMERSLYSSFEVFVEQSKTAMDKLEYEALKYFFEVSKNGALDKITRPDLIIYLRTDSDVCFERMKHRNRTAEQSVSLDVLDNLNTAYDNWLLDGAKIPCPMLVLDGNLDKCDWTVQTNKINRTILEIANIKANK